MSWAFLPIIAGYGVLAWLLAQLGFSIVGESPAGKRAVPVVSAAWPLALAFLLMVAIAALIDTAFDRSTAWIRNPEDRR